MDALAVFGKHESVFSHACMAILNDEFPSYCCIECVATTTVFCPRCFFNSEHKNHFYIVNENMSGLCDCGDGNGMMCDDFCEFHKQKSGYQFCLSREQFKVYFAAALDFLKLYEQDINIDLNQIAAESLVTRFLCLACLFGENADFVYDYYYSFDRLYAKLIENDYAELRHAPLLFFYSRGCEPLFYLLVKDYYFRVLGFAFVLFTSYQSSKQEELIILMASQIVTEPFTMRYVAGSGIIETIMDQIALGNGGGAEALQAIVYNLEIMDCPEMVEQLIYRGFLTKLYALYYKVVDLLPIDTFNVCYNHITFFQQFEKYFYLLVMYRQLFAAGELSWISYGKDLADYRRYHVKRDCIYTIAIQAQDLERSFAYQQLIEICRTLFDPQHYFKENHFVFLPNVLPHCIMLNFVLKVGIPPAQLIDKIACALGLDKQDLLYKLTNTLLFSIVPLFKIAFGHFKKYCYELTAIVSGSALSNIYELYFIAFQFLQTFLPLSTFKLSIFTRHFHDAGELAIFVAILNSIMFFPYESDVLRCYISNMTLTKENFSVASLFYSLETHLKIYKSVLDSLLEFRKGPTPFHSKHTRLTTTYYIEPSLCFLNQDNLFNVYAQQYQSSSLFERITRTSFDGNVKNLVSYPLLDFLANAYTSESFSVSVRIAILRIFLCSGYISKISYYSTDGRLVPIEKRVFCAVKYCLCNPISLKQRCQLLKRKCGDSESYILQISNEFGGKCCAEPERAKSADMALDNTCVLCHQQLDNDTSFSLFNFCQNGPREMALCCPHRYHSECVDSVQSQCAICGGYFNIIISANVVALYNDGLDDSILDFLDNQNSVELKSSRDTPNLIFQVAPASFNFSAMIEANEQTAVFVSDLYDLADDHKALILQRLEYSTSMLRHFGGISELRLPVPYKSLQKPYLILYDMFPNNLSDVLCRFSTNITCEACKKSTSRVCIDLQNGAIVCSTCATSRNAYWNIFFNSIHLYQVSFVAPYRDIFGQVYRSIGGFEKHFDPEMLQYAVFMCLTGYRM